MMIVSMDGIIRVGNDFVDAVAGKPHHRGQFTLDNGRSYHYVSTVDGDRAHKAIDTAARREGRKAVSYQWQAV